MNKTFVPTNDHLRHANRLKEISNELFTMANCLAGDTTGIAAASLHGVVGRLTNVARMITSGITLDDRKQVIREHLKNRTFNRNKSEAEIEQLVEMFVKMDA
jgi:hypothetical protein